MKKIYGVALADGTRDLPMTDFVRLSSVRNEMIKFYRNRQKRWSRGECYSVPQIVAIF